MKAATAIILAAERASQMNSAKPTALHEVAGRPIIDWMLAAFEGCVETPPVIVDGSQQMIVAHVGERARTAVQQEALGEADALRAARRTLEAAGNGLVFVISGSYPLISAELCKQLAEEAGNSGAAALAIFNEDEAGEDGAEEPILCDLFCAPGNVWLAGLMCSSKEARLEDCFLQGVESCRITPALVENLHTGVAHYFPVTNRAMLAACEAEAQELLRDKHLENGVTMLDPNSVTLGADVEIGRDTVLWPNVVLTGRTVIGEGCVIKSGCQINDTRVGNGCTLTYVVANEAELGNRVTAGPFVNLRPNTCIADGCKIGDFVEVKNSSVGEGTKLPHLSYIGDADVGSGVNVGCGCVFVNYDGYAKHRTTVGDNVFLGCQTNLVAPVTVGDGAYTAAGSTITHDVPAGAMAFARARQSNKEGYVEKFRSLKKK